MSLRPARYRRVSEVLWRRAGESVVLLPLRRGGLLNLTGSGGSLWDLLDEPRTIAEVADKLAATFGVPVGELHDDVAGAVAALEDAGVVAKVTT